MPVSDVAFCIGIYGIVAGVGAHVHCFFKIGKTAGLGTHPALYKTFCITVVVAQAQVLATTFCHNGTMMCKEGIKGLS